METQIYLLYYGWNKIEKYYVTLAQEEIYWVNVKLKAARDVKKLELTFVLIPWYV